MSQFALVVGLLAALISASGCAEKKLLSVSGKVTRGGQPLTEAKSLLVVLVPENGGVGARPYSAETDSAAGTFRVPALPPGRYRVAIQQFDDQFRDALGGVYDAGASPLVYDVINEGQVIDIDLPTVLPSRTLISGVLSEGKGPGRKGGGAKAGKANEKE
jgi:hypothetical protein